MSTSAVPVPVLVRAARALTRACRFDDAEALLTPGAAGADDPALAMARAELAVARAYLLGGTVERHVLAAARLAVDRSDDPIARWDLSLLELRVAYATELFAPGTRMADPSGRDPDTVRALRAAAEGLRDTAPDRGRRGSACFYLGVIHDNLLGERAAAPAHYEEALAEADAADDHHGRFEALRHLGDHDHDAGDGDRARDRWERSAAAAARGGEVAAVLAQQLLLAQLARERGEEPAARLLAAEVVRGADAVGALRLRDQAASLLEGVDPTAG